MQFITFTLFHRLTLTNVEDQIVSSLLVNDNNCIVSMSEFALRLQISPDDPNTIELFQIFDTVNMILHC